jgi:predicted GNAT superfamily acetyltransferase
MNDEITIRRAASVADYRACQEAQRRAWGIDDEGYVVPVATLVGAQLHGGLVLGAFLAGGEAVGVSFAFLGRVEGRLCLYSQLTGVVPGYQGRGLGGRLKHAQRDIARAEGIGRIAWAFDPLQAGNAHFNLDRLGASAGRYVVDMYGPRTDALNAGTPTDRLIAEWETAPEDGPRAAPDAGTALPRLIAASPRGDGVLAVAGVDERPTDPEVLLEIPEDIQGLRRREPALSGAWQQAVRGAFTSAFAAGYRAVGFLRDEAEGPRRSFYVLRRVARP